MELSEGRESAEDRCWAACEGSVILVSCAGLPAALLGIFWSGSLRRDCEVDAPGFECDIAALKEP